MDTPRKLAAILAADIAGYSRLMGLDEAGTAKALRGCPLTTMDLVSERLKPAVQARMNQLEGASVRGTSEALFMQDAARHVHI